MRVEAVDGLTVSLRVNGTDLQEYDDDADQLYIPSHGIKYVEATPGANFQVHVHARGLRWPKPHDSVECAVYLDGKWVAGKVLNMKTVCDIDGVTEKRDGGYYHRKFEFCDLQTNDASVKGVDMKAIKNLGEVKVVCHWVLRDVKDKDYEESWGEADQPESVPEKCLKGRSISSKAK